MRLTLPLIVLMLLAACAGPESAATSEERLRSLTAALPDGVVGAPYSAQLGAIGGKQPYTWTLTSGALPAGITLSIDGKLTGTPAAAGTANIQITLRDSGMNAIPLPLSLVIITAPPLQISGNAPPAFTGSAFLFTPSVSGGVGAPTFAITAGALPSGLGVDANTGLVSGVPTLTGSYLSTLTATDLAGGTASMPLHIVVHRGVTLLGWAALPEGYAGNPWYARLDATGGVAPYTWSAVSGVPAWMNLTTRGDGWLELTGAPASVGTYTFTLAVQDALGASHARAFTMTVAPAPTPIADLPAIVTTALPRATVGEYYETELRALGGYTAFRWVVNNPLPAGLYMDAAPAPTTILRGRPVVAGVYDCEIWIKDTVNPWISRTLQLVVQPAFEALPDASVGTDYDYSPQLSDGGAGFAAAVDSLALVNGLTAATPLHVSGTPATAGRVVYSLMLNDGTDLIFLLAGLDVGPAATALTITTQQLPPATRGSGYAYRGLLQAEGGSGTGYQWAVVSGAMPGGFTGLPASGPAPAAITGSTDTVGSYSFTVSVTDSASNVSVKQFTLQVLPPVRGDFDGDRWPDLVVGTQFEAIATGSNPGISLFYGEPARRRFGEIGDTSADLTIEAMCQQVAQGDFDGDGISDIAYSKPTEFGPAGVGVLFGARSRRMGSVAADLTINAAGIGKFGDSISLADLDGDGADDLLVGAPLTATAAGTQAGVVYIYYGGPGRVAGTIAHTQFDAVLEGEVQGGANTAPGRLGDSMFARDLDADGVADLVIGCSARAYIVYGGSRHSGALTIGSLAGAQFDDCIGSAMGGRLAAGDFNGDGAVDIFIGGKTTYGFYATTGAVPFSGNYSGTAADVVIQPGAVSSNNRVVIASGDLNADGIDDLVIGSQGAARAMFFWGSTSHSAGLNTDWAAAALALDYPASWNGGWCVFVCDYDNDGRDDVGIGAMSAMNYSQGGQRGALFIHYGDTDIPASGYMSGQSVAGVKFLATRGGAGYGAVGSGG